MDKERFNSILREYEGGEDYPILYFVSIPGDIVESEDEEIDEIWFKGFQRLLLGDSNDFTILMTVLSADNYWEENGKAYLEYRPSTFREVDFKYVFEDELEAYQVLNHKLESFFRRGSQSPYRVCKGGGNNG